MKRKQIQFCALGTILNSEVLCVMKRERKKWREKQVYLIHGVRNIGQPLVRGGGGVVRYRGQTRHLTPNISRGSKTDMYISAQKMTQKHCINFLSVEIAYQFCTILKSVKKPTAWLQKSFNKFLEKS